MTDAPTLKRCQRCRTWKSPSDFIHDSKTKDGLHLWCRECVAVDHPNVSKQCAKCLKIKSGVEFSKALARMDGLQQWCRACMRTYATDRRDRLRASRDRP